MAGNFSVSTYDKQLHILAVREICLVAILRVTNLSANLRRIMCNNVAFKDEVLQQFENNAMNTSHKSVWTVLKEYQNL